MNRNKVLFNWSSGKDSALALSLLLNDDQYKVSMLLTTVNRAYDRISQHGVRVELLERQAASLGIPLKKVRLPKNLSMEQYSSIMDKALSDFRRDGHTHSAFGDIFLEELRSYREARLSETGFKALFPLWKKDTRELAEQFIDEKFSAVVVCVNEHYLDRSFAGREFDRDFIRDLPESVDPCGENGEFHTFVYDGPIFRKRIEIERGEIVYRKKETQGESGSSESNQSDSYTCSAPEDQNQRRGLWFCDLDMEC